MGTSQAFRTALHIPVIDPGAAQVVSTTSGGDMYTSAWVTTSGIDEAPLDGQQYGRTSSAWTVIVPNPTWSTLSGKPSTFPPTVPIAQSDITNLTADLALKAPLDSPVFTGDPKAPTPTAGDNDTSVATTSFVVTALSSVNIDCGTY